VPTERIKDPVVCEVEIDATPDTVFQFFTDPELMVRWMGSAATLNPQPGGTFAVDVQGEWNARGEYVAVEPPRRVVFTWGWDTQESVVAPGSSTVEVVLEPQGGGTLVTLSHGDLPADARESHGMGWRHYLARLGIAGAGGDPGPDPGPGAA
jgi:uncharacterized protein YndB with AHSA1/START domain